MRMSKRAQKTFHMSAKEWMVDRVAIYRPGVGEIDEETNVTSPTLGEKVYEGMARIRPSSGPRDVEMGEGQIAHRNADVNIPHDADIPWVDDVVEVLATQDAPLKGQWLKILDVRLFSQQMMRRMSTEMIQPSRLHNPDDRYEGV